MGKEMSGFTTRAVGYSSASMVLLVLALILSSKLFMIGGLLTLAMMLISFAFIPRKPKITRIMERDQIFENETSEVMVKVEGKKDIGNLEVIDRLSVGMELKTSSNCAMLPPGKRSYRYEIDAPLRGYHPVGPTSIRRWDPMWLWEVKDGSDTAVQTQTW